MKKTKFDYSRFMVEDYHYKSVLEEMDYSAELESVFIDSYLENENHNIWTRRHIDLISTSEYNEGIYDCIQAGSLEDTAINNGLVSTLYEGIAALENPMRDRLIQYYFYRRTMDEIAASEKVSRIAVLHSLHAAEGKIRKYFVDRGYVLDSECPSK